MDTRGVCKDVISASDIFTFRLVIKCNFLKKSFSMNVSLTSQSSLFGGFAVLDPPGDIQLTKVYS